MGNSIDQGQIALRAAIASLTASVEGFNVRSLSLGDLLFHCTARQIEIVWLPMRLANGVSFQEQAVPVIALNLKLPNPWKVIVGWHEYAHHVLGHIEHGAAFSSPDSKQRQPLEFQAHAIGMIALMPDALIRGMSARKIARAFNVNIETARFRLSL
jgi:Zn-dependent peptidase ImmA (M78 family)